MKFTCYSSVEAYYSFDWISVTVQGILAYKVIGNFPTNPSARPTSPLITAMPHQCFDI